MRRCAILFAVVLLSGCDGHYKDLEKQFKSEIENQPSIGKGASVSFSSRHRSGIYSLNNLVRVGISTSWITLDVVFPFSLFHSPLQIPSESVGGCGCADFGEYGRDAQLYIPSTGSEVSFKDNMKIFDWCWNNKIPVIPGDIEREWQYNDGSFPEKSIYEGQFKSREQYDYLVKRSCMGW